MSSKKLSSQKARICGLFGLTWSGTKCYYNQYLEYSGKNEKIINKFLKFPLLASGIHM